MLGYLKVGDIFGQQSAIEDITNEWTIEVSSKEAEVYKIHRSNFVQYFGGLDGLPASHLRALRLLYNNWLQVKLQFLSKMSLEQLLQLEYRSKDFDKL